MRETLSIPVSKLRTSLKSEHDARAAILQVAIRRASARRHDIIGIVFPQEARQSYYVHASNGFLHVVIRIWRNVFMNYKHVFMQLLLQCTLCNQGNLMKLGSKVTGYTEVYTPPPGLAIYKG
jgi:hypothetical protein